MAKTVQNLIDEIKMRRDVGNVADEELLEYINELDAHFMESLYPSFDSSFVAFSTGTYTYDVSTFTDMEGVYKVFVDGVPILRKRTAVDGLDGWYGDGSDVAVSPDYVDEGATGMTVVYKKKRVPHLLEEMNTDTNLAIPASYHDLYIYHVLAQLASKDADTASYTNYQSDFNSLLSEMLAITTKNQLAPNYSIS